MRVTTAFNRLLSLPRGVSVPRDCFEDEELVVDVALRRRRARLHARSARSSTAACYDDPAGVLALAAYRHGSLGKVLVRAGLRRLACPAHGVRVEAVPFARHRSELSRGGDFEDLSRSWRPRPTRPRSYGCPG